MNPTPTFSRANARGRDPQAVSQRARTLACLGLLSICAHLFFTASLAAAEESAAPRAEAAKQLFQSICARCHGPDGRGGPQRETMPAIPNFTDAKWQKSRTNIQMMISILEGKNLQMPANRGPVTDEQAPDLVAYIRTFAPSAAPKTAVNSTVNTTTNTTGNTPTTTTTLADLTIEDTSDFAIEFNKLAKEWADSNRQFHELVSASVHESPSVPAVASASKEIEPAAPVYAKPITTDDVDRGRELFMGQRRLAAGGASCISCHAVAGSTPREGGRLGPDLTKVFERIGGRAALRGELLTPTTPAMCALYQQHALESDEASSLAAYLEDADKHGVEQASGPPLNLFLMGLGGTVLGLATVSTFWRSRFRPRSQSPLNSNGAAARHSDHELPARIKRRAKVGSVAPVTATAGLAQGDLGAGL